MVNGNCAVVNRTNSKYKLRQWREKNCDLHAGKLKQDCPCTPPFHLHSFSSVKRNFERRKEWIRLINRTTKRNTAWNPGQSDMVCSIHFIDGEPTVENPNPTFNHRNISTRMIGLLFSLAKNGRHLEIHNGGIMRAISREQRFWLL